MLSRWFALPLWVRIFAGMILGLAFGLALPEQADAIKPVGDFFIRAIKMLVVPLIFISLVNGVAGMPDLSRLGKIGGKTIGFYLLCTVFATTLGILFGNLFQPGVGAIIPVTDAGAVAKTPPGIWDLIFSLAPTNIIEAMATTQILGVIVFALMLGLAIAASGDLGEPLRALFASADVAMGKMVGWVMELAPLGVAALMAWVTGSYGLAQLLPLAKLIGTLYFVCILHGTIITLVLIGGVARLNPLRFARKVVEPFVVAYCTSTSNGTLPVTMRTGEQKLGLSKSVVSFCMPLGATLNMDGLAIYLGLIPVFTAQAMGIELSFVQYGAIIFAATLGSAGAAGVPSGGLFLMPLVLGAAGLPLDVIALVAAVDRVMDMMRTSINVVGDLIVATAVARLEGEIDLDRFNDPNA